MIVSAQAPTRVDLAGGTIDLWPIHQILARSATVNVGIGLDAKVNIGILEKSEFSLHSQDQSKTVKGSYKDVAHAEHPLGLLGLILKHYWSSDLPSLTVETLARSPAGAGLGGSSTLTISMLSALFKLRQTFTKEFIPSEQNLVRIAQDIEAQIIHAPTGCQDYWGAVRGNINCIEFPPGGENILTVPAQEFEDLSTHMVIVYSGQSRASAINNWEIYKRVFDGDKNLILKLQNIGAEAHECIQAVKQRNLEQLLFHSEKEWQLRKALWPNIETAMTTKIDLAAKKAGASFTRVCGAGGGGVMVAFAPQERHEALKAALAQAGGQVLDTQIASRGIQVHYVN